MTIKIDSDKLVSWLQLILLLLIAGTLLFYKPWNNSSTSDQRTVTVTGKATVEAAPSEFSFTPYFEQKGANESALRESLVGKANDLVATLKGAGVSEEDISIDANSYDRWYWEDDSQEEGVMTVRVNIKVDNKELAQTVQDHLLTLDVKGQLSPRASFSDSQKDSLESKALEEASKDARERAETQANLLGADIGKVVRINEQPYVDYPAYYDAAITEEASPVSASLPVLPGQNEYSKTITVTYELK